MYGLKISSLLALAVAIPSVLATPPACLLACVSQVEKKSSCDSLGDFSCICSAEFSAVESCLDSICPNGDAASAKSAFSSSCGGYASSVVSSASSSAASSSSSSAASSSAASSSSVASSAAPASSKETSTWVSTSEIVSSSAAPSTTVSSVISTSATTSSAHPSITETAGANEIGKSFGAAAVIGLVGALL